MCKTREPRVPARKRRADGDRHFAENRAPERASPAFVLFATDLDDLDPASENRKERAVSPFRNGELSGTQMQVGGCPRGTPAIASVENNGIARISSIVSIVRLRIEGRK